MVLNRLLLVGAVFAVAQVTVVDLLRIRSVAPDLLFLFAAWICLQRRIDEALFPAWIAGLIKDCASLSEFGAFGFLFVFAGVMISTFKDYLFRDSLLVQIGLVFAGALAADFFYGSALARDSHALSLGWVLGRSVGAALYTALCAPFAFALLDSLRSYLRLRS